MKQCQEVENHSRHQWTLEMWERIPIGNTTNATNILRKTMDLTWEEDNTCPEKEILTEEN